MRRARPLRTAPRPGLGPPKRVVLRPFRGRGAVFHWRGAFRAPFRLPIRPAVGWVWRRRLALKSATAVAQNLLNRREDEAALRDAIALAKPGQELGPAGRVYAAFRTLSSPATLFAPSASPRSPATCSRRSTRKRRRTSPLRCGRWACRSSGPGRRGRGRRGGDRAAGRRRAACDLLRRRRAGQGLRLANAAAAACQRALLPPRRGRRTTIAPGRSRLGSSWR